jgi:hypothetical protein
MITSALFELLFGLATPNQSPRFPDVIANLIMKKLSPSQTRVRGDENCREVTRFGSHALSQGIFHALD